MLLNYNRICNSKTFQPILHSVTLDFKLYSEEHIHFSNRHRFHSKYLIMKYHRPSCERTHCNVKGELNTKLSKQLPLTAAQTHLLNMSSMRCVTTKPPNTLINETKAAPAPNICK